MKLSILIATIPERADMCARLVRFLTEQANGLPVEILTDPAPKGAISIGVKRNALYDAASGTHAVSIDDDDWVPNDYVPTVLDGLTTDPDCIGHYELVEGMAKAPQLSRWSNKDRQWLEGANARRLGFDYIRTTFHKTPLRTSIARDVRFNDMGFGEDHDFSKRLKASGLCRREVFIPRVLYFYRYIHQDHATKYGA